MIEFKTHAEVEGIRAAGAVVAGTLRAIKENARVGTRLDELDELARTVMTDAEAVPLRPAAISCSLNDALLHGRPDRTRLATGDLLSIEAGAQLQRWCATAAVSLIIGNATEHDTELVNATNQALDDGIAAAQPDGRVGDIAHAVGIVGRSAGYGIPTRGGHGIGRRRREDPVIANDGAAGRGTPLRPGMVLAIAPMFSAGGNDEVDTDDTGTVRTRDGSHAAHCAHTVAITEQGPQVLTLP